MIRTGLLCTLAGLLFVSAGCRKPDEEAQHAVVAQGELMPSARPGFAAAYVADQKQVKMVERTVSYEPLETFRSRAAAKDSEEASSDMKPREAKRAKAEPVKKKGLFGRFKAALTDKVGSVSQGLGGGGAPPGDMGDVQSVYDDDEDMDTFEDESDEEGDNLDDDEDDKDSDDEEEEEEEEDLDDDEDEDDDLDDDEDNEDLDDEDEDDDS